MRFFADELEKWREKQLLRRLPDMEPRGPVEALVEEKPCLLFCTNDYLGLTHHPLVLERSREALAAYGTGAGASRLVSGNFSLHQRLEEATARFKETEAALMFSSGFLTNLAVLTALIQQEDFVAADRLNHASLLDACRTVRATFRVYPHGDLDVLEKLLRRGKDARRRWIVTDGVFSMDGDIAPLVDLSRLAREHDAEIIVDDAHGTGVLGPRGKGVSALFPDLPKKPWIIGTYSKALAAQGGFFAGPRLVVEYLIQKARPLIYSTAPAPAVVGAALGALEVLESDPTPLKCLRENVRRLRKGLEKIGRVVSSQCDVPIFPLIFGETEEALKASRKLYEEGFFVPAIRPPTVPQGSARLRVTVSAAHSFEHIDRLLDALRRL